MKESYYQLPGREKNLKRQTTMIMFVKKKKSSFKRDWTGFKKQLVLTLKCSELLKENNETTQNSYFKRFS